MAQLDLGKVVGDNGADGATWLSGAVDPTTEGVDGDFYLNTVSYDVFKKVSGAWGAALLNIKGATGDTGATGTAGTDGADGVGVPVGGAAGQVLAKVDSTDYNTQWVTSGTGGSTDAVDIDITDTGTLYDATNVETALAEVMGDLNTHKAESTAHGINLKANKSTITTKTLLSANWTGTETPYSYTLSVAGVTLTSVQEILPTVDITSTQLLALVSATIQDGGQSVDSITLKAWGTKPTIDLPIRVILRGDL